MVSTLGSGIASTLRPFGSRYSVTPSIDATACGAGGAASRAGCGAAQATSASAAATANRLKSFLAALLAETGPQFLAAHVLAGLADFLAPRKARAALGFAARRVLRLRAHLLHHALVVLGAALALARGARAARGVLHLRHALFAGLRILLLSAHLPQHAVAVLRTLLPLAGLLRLRALGPQLLARLVGAGRLCVQARGRRGEQRADERWQNPHRYASCFSIVAASDTSNLPGASTFNCLTTPLSTSIEKRCMRVPMPRALRSSSRPSFLVHSAEPSARKRILPSAFWSRPQCAMTKASLVARHHTSLTPFFLSESMFCT